MRRKSFFVCVPVVLAAVLLPACGTQQRLPEGIDASKRDWYGEFYNLNEYAKCRAQVHKNDMACEYLRLTREDEPEYWPYPNVPRPKLPDAPSTPVYRAGMNTRQYFRALCKEEAGEFIYRVVEDVEGIYQIRPRKRASTNALQDRFVLEDPYGYTDTEAFEPWIVFVGPHRYSFLEIPSQGVKAPNTERQYRDPSLFLAPMPGARVARDYGYDGRRLISTKRSFDREIRSRYGFVWRGISRPHDRELAIAGGELAVVDLKTGEVLGLRRGFIASGKARTHSGVNWEPAAVCPAHASAPGLHKSDDFAYSFISKVLKHPSAAKPKK